VGTWRDAIGANTVVQLSIAEGVSAAERWHLHGVLSAQQQCAPPAAATITGSTASRIDNDRCAVAALVDCPDPEWARSDPAIFTSLLVSRRSMSWSASAAAMQAPAAPKNVSDGSLAV
jgi:hypothetical protein